MSNQIDLDSTLIRRLGKTMAYPIIVVNLIR